MIAYVINPGSGSIKLACAEVLPSTDPTLPSLLEVELERAELTLEETPCFSDVPELIKQLLPLTVKWPRPDAVVGRGGSIGKVPAGTYVVTDDLVDHVNNLQQKNPEDSSVNLGVVLAQVMAESYAVPAFIVDPQSVEELLPEARMTGVLGVSRTARFHALNARAVARRAAHEAGQRFTDSRVVVAHLGSTTSVTAFENARAIDTTGMGVGGGPMGARQAGPLPVSNLMQLLRQPDYKEGTELLQYLTHESGFFALTGTANLREIESRLDNEDTVKDAVAGFVHQVCKAIGEQAAALSGRPDAIALTGGIANWDEVVNQIERRISWIATLTVIAGEMELEALAEGAARAMFGLEPLREWTADEVVTHAAKNMLKAQSPKQLDNEEQD